MFRALAFFLVLVLVGLFALINWGAFAALTTLSLGVTTVQAPLGLIMLGLVAFLCVLFIVWVITLQGTALATARRQTRELQTQRDLADRAEASRLIELRTELIGRLDHLQAEVQRAVETNANTIAAHVGQLEDRIDRERLLSPPTR